MANALVLILCGQAAADVRERFERLERLHGFGWGDGYHSCYDAGPRLFADLPPRPYASGARQPSHHGCSNCFPAPAPATFYDRFDAGLPAAEPSVLPPERTVTRPRAVPENAQPQDVLPPAESLQTPPPAPETSRIPPLSRRREPHPASRLDEQPPAPQTGAPATGASTAAGPRGKQPLLKARIVGLHSTGADRRHPATANGGNAPRPGQQKTGEASSASGAPQAAAAADGRTPATPAGSRRAAGAPTRLPRPASQPRREAADEHQRGRRTPRVAHRPGQKVERGK